MIVKDESAVITRCLDSVKQMIDYWLIVDTGSSDDTETKVRESLQGVPGEFLHRPWVDFGHNRTELVRLGRGRADYLLLLDADMEVLFGEFEKRLVADAYLLKYAGQLDYSQKLLVRSDLDWKYVGSTHEYIHCDSQRSVDLLRTLAIVHHADGGTRGEKLTRDETLLERAVKQNPHDPRSVFYLAQTYRDAGKLESAIEAYRHRAALGGWAEEAWYATYQAGLLLETAGRWNEAFCWLLKAFELCPARAEPLYWIARHFRLDGQHQLGYLFASRAAEVPYPSGQLFVERDVYEYQIDDERSICAFYVGKPAESSAICRNLLDRPTLPETYRPRVEKNKSFGDADRKRVILGLGTGRCGTMSLSELLNEQPEMTCHHESMLIPWSYHPTILDRLIQSLQSQESPCVGEVAFYLLHYVEPLLARYPDARVVCLKRDRDETIASYMEWTGSKNHWTARDSRHWNDEWTEAPLDRCFPQFDADKYDGIGLFWDHYYSFTTYLEQRHFRQVRQFSIADLNSAEGQRSILSFVGVADDAMRINPGIRANERVMK